MPFWMPRTVRIKRLLRTAVDKKKVGLTVQGRDESGNLRVTSSDFSAYIGESVLY